MARGLDHQRETIRPVIAPPGNQADADGISTHHQPEAIVLDLVDPTGPRRRMVGRGWQARLNEAGPAGVRQHVNLDIEQMRESQLCPTTEPTQTTGPS